jgi:uncharacterized protein
MFKIADFGRAAAATLIIAGLGLSGVARAADATDAQMKAAHAAIEAIGATQPFDNILPDISERLKATLIQSSPNFQDIISSTVDQKALDLAPRRGDLEKEASAIYAKAFTVEELNAIATFFNSPVGKKFLTDVPLANRELYKAADIWGAGIQRDLTSESTKALDKIIGAKVKAGQAPALLPADSDTPPPAK